MLEDRGEIDARRMRCKDAELKPTEPFFTEVLHVETYVADGQTLKKFRDMKHALKDAGTAQEYDDALIAFVTFVMENGKKIIADIRSGMIHEELG